MPERETNRPADSYTGAEIEIVPSPREGASALGIGRFRYSARYGDRPWRRAGS